MPDICKAEEEYKSMLLCGARVSGEVVMRWTKGIWYQSWMKYAIMRRYTPNPVNTGVRWFRERPLGPTVG